VVQVPSGSQKKASYRAPFDFKWAQA